jgi:hypothetical protein
MNDQQTAVAATTAVALGTQPLEATEQQKRLAIGLISGCHTLNHLQYSITSVIFPVMMNDLGFGLLQLGMLSAISNFVGQGLQVIYGFIAGFFKRTVVLGVGNVIVGLSGVNSSSAAILSSWLHASPLTPARVLSTPSEPAFYRAISLKHAAGPSRSIILQGVWDHLSALLWRPSLFCTLAGKRLSWSSALRVC